MNHRELANALAALPEGSVGALVEAAVAIRRSEEVLAGFNGKKARRKRGPNKPKPEALPAPPAPVVKKSHHKKAAAPAVTPKPLSAALDRLKAKKVPGLKVRRTVPEDDEE